MRKLLLLAIAILFTVASVSVSAKVRTISEAQRVAATHFATQKVTTRASSAKIVQTIVASDILPKIKTRSSSSGEPFYVFVSSGGGHVIVSGDDRISPILGYSDYGFNKDKVNPALRDLLTIYGLVYDQVQATGVPAVLTAPRSATRALKPSVAPLLNGITYGQEYPFNLMCPVVNGKNGYTGCVATAMAMVMRYHKYPDRAVGMGGGLDPRPGNVIDLGQQPLEWDKILPNNGGTNENHMAVSWLMRCVGAAVNTLYQNSGSGAGAQDISGAFADNFLYDQNVRIVDRDGYTLSQWFDMARAEISAGRPIVYTGMAMGATEGHAFVLDGYSEDGLFSVNWGYEGTPAWHAISGLAQYTNGENAIIGIQKPVDGGEYMSNFARLSSSMDITESSIDRTGTFTVKESWNYVNKGGTFTGNIGLVLYKDGAVAAVLGTVPVDKLVRDDQVTIGFKNVSIPSTVAPGRYQLHVASKDNREKAWRNVEMGLEGLPYYHVDITTSAINFSSPVNKNAAKVVKFTINPDKIYLKEFADFAAEVQNDGSEWAGYFILRLTNLKTGATDDPMYLNQWKSIVFPGKNIISQQKYMGLAPGEYKVDLMYSFDGANNWGPLPGSESKTFTLHPENYEKYKYYVIANYSGMERSTVTNKEKPRIVLELSCVGANDIENGAFLSVIKGGNLPHPLFLPIPLSIKKGETRRIVLEAEQEMPDGEYEWELVQFSSPDGTAFVIPGLQRSYKFSVRTFGAGK